MQTLDVERMIVFIYANPPKNTMKLCLQFAIAIFQALDAKLWERTESVKLSKFLTLF